MFVIVTKVGQGRTKLLLVQCLHWVYQAVKYEVHVIISWLCSGSGNVAKFGEFSKLGWLCRPISRKR